MIVPWRIVLNAFLCAATLLALASCARPDAKGTAAQGVENDDPHLPNVVLIVFEDMGQRIGAFGDPVAVTPALDAFAREAVSFPNAFTTSGVCAPSRAALITGVHQQTLGAQHMRTRGAMGLSGGGPIEYDAVPPPSVKAFPELMRAEGYYVSNDFKTDYQFGEPFTVWDVSAEGADWRGRDQGQPFFAMITLLKTHESYIWPQTPQTDNRMAQLVAARNQRDLVGKAQLVAPEDVEVPPYLPDTPIVRADIARHYDNIAFQEKALADILDKLREDGVLEKTIVIVTSDHGDGLPRMKRSVYDSGLRTPLMVRFPDGAGAGTVDERLVSFVDLAPTLLSWAGADLPDYHHGWPFMTATGGQPDGAAPREFVFAAADRHDTVQDRYRAVRDSRYKYIRNYQPDHAFFRPLAFRDLQPTMRELWRLYREGALTQTQALYFTAPRPAEELYDTQVDPHEIDNLAGDPALAATQARLSEALDAWIEKTGDLGALPEAEMIARLWPNMEQPVTAPPSITVETHGAGRMLSLASATPGASIGYRFPDDPAGRWRLYAARVQLPEGARMIEAKAVRYGYAESDVVTERINAE